MQRTRKTAPKPQSIAKPQPKAAKKSPAELSEAIPAKKTLAPNMPVGVFLQEAYNIYRFVQADREHLLAINFDWSIVEGLPERIEYLRETETEWWSARFSRMPVEKEYRELLPKVREAFRELLHDLEFACRGDTDHMRVIKKIRKDAAVDMARYFQCLTTLSLLAAETKDRLEAIGSDPRLFDFISETTESLPSLSSRLRSEREAVEEMRRRRDRAYTLLRASIEELRSCARYALAGDAARLKGYASDYFRMANRAKKKKGEGENGQPGFSITAPDR
jgi:hypothetical protein